MLVVLIGFASLTIDVGYLYNVRAELQNTADAAALAGAQMLPDEAAVRQIAVEYAKARHQPASLRFNNNRHEHQQRAS